MLVYVNFLYLYTLLCKLLPQSMLSIVVSS